MLDSIVSEDNRYQNRMEIITNVFQQTTSLESINELEKKLIELRESEHCLIELLGEIHVKRNSFQEILKQEDSLLNEDDDNGLKEMSEELNQIEILNKNTTLT